MKIALADAITKWAELEDALAFLLQAVLQTQFGYGLVIYFVPTATETRFAIVNAAVSVFLRREPVMWQFVPIWPRILDKLGKSKRLRNKLAHGSVIRFNRDRVTTVRLTEPFTLLSQTRIGSQLPGMSLHDVRIAHDQIWSCVSAVSHLSVAINAMVMHRATVETLHQIASELESHLKSGATQIGGLTAEDLLSQAAQSAV